MEKTLPQKPKLRPYFHIVPRGDERLLVRGGDHTVVLRGLSVRDLMPLLLPHLDGSATVREIAAALPSVDGEVVAAALTLLHEQRLLEDAAVAPPPELAHPQRFRQQGAFWLALDGDRYAHQRTLAASHAAIFGLGAVGAAVAHGLAAAGVGTLTLLDPHAASDADALPFGGTTRDGGRTRAAVAGFRLSDQYPDVRCRVADAPTETPDDVIAALRGCDVAIMCADTATVTGFELINEACLQVGIPWLRAALDHHRGVVGPTVIPHETACFTCLTLRTRGNAASVEDAMAFEQHLREGNTAAECAVLAPFAGLVAQQAALEVVKVLTGFAHPVTVGALLALDAITGETTRREVLKLPRCPVCGPGRSRPQMKIWDIATTTGRGEG